MWPYQIILFLASLSISSVLVTSLSTTTQSASVIAGQQVSIKVQNAASQAHMLAGYVTVKRGDSDRSATVRTLQLLTTPCVCGTKQTLTRKCAVALEDVFVETANASRMKM